jgi:hypothetical protein
MLKKILNLFWGNFYAECNKTEISSAFSFKAVANGPTDLLTSDFICSQSYTHLPVSVKYFSYVNK